MLILFPRDRCFLFLAVWRIFDWFNAFFCASCLLVGGDAEIRSLETPAGRSIKFPQPTPVKQQQERFHWAGGVNRDHREKYHFVKIREEGYPMHSSAP